MSFPSKGGGGDKAAALKKLLLIMKMKQAMAGQGGAPAPGMPPVAGPPGMPGMPPLMPPAQGQ